MTPSCSSIYFSGHGGRIEVGPHAGQYLLPVDAVYSDGRAIAQTSISGPEFTAALTAILARKVLVVFDCCHASGICQPKDAATPTFKTGLPNHYYSEALKTGTGLGRRDEGSPRKKFSTGLPQMARLLTQTQRRDRLVIATAKRSIRIIRSYRHGVCHRDDNYRRQQSLEVGWAQRSGVWVFDNSEPLHTKTRLRIEDT